MLFWFAFWGALAGVVFFIVDQVVASFLRRATGTDDPEDARA